MRTELRANENIVLTIRKHWIVFVGPVLATIFALFLGIALYGGSPESGIAFIAIALVPLPVIAWREFDRRTNLWIITDRRYIDEYGIISANTKECSLERVQNIDVRQGLLGRILNYGSVAVQTAAEQGATLSKHVARPKLLKKTLIDAQDRFKEREAVENARRIAASVAQNPPGSAGATEQ
jgi:uncharacterized membrane protein YdbT with pleckstrin-like domain